MPTKIKTQQNILARLGLDNLPEETKIEVLTKMTESVLKRLTVVVLGSLSEKDQKEFLELQKDGPNIDAAEDFIKTHIPNFEEIQNKVVAEFIEEMQDTVGLLREGVEEFDKALSA